MEGFCIREYASRMRSVDVVKCWPLDETTCQETVRSLLPPITIKKFTYWLDELQNFHHELSAQKDMNNSKGKEKVKSLGGKGNFKTPPKKRSIVEIFAVAPQVERVSTSSADKEGEDENENGVFASKWSGKGKRNCNKKKNKEIILRKLKKAKQIIKKSKKNVDDDKVDLSSPPNKENPLKMKLQSQDKAIENPNSSYSKESENDLHERLCDFKRKPDPNRSDAYKRTMSCKTSKLIEENENSRLSACGILKNHDEAFYLKQSSQCISEETSFQVNHCDKQKAANHDISNIIADELDFGPPHPRSPPVYFKEYLKTYDEPSASVLSNLEKRANERPQGSSELMDNFWSLPDRKHSSKMINDRMDKDLVGLPLNSRGELMALNTSDKRDFRISSEHVSWDFRTFSKKDHVFIPSRSDITESQSNEIADSALNLLKTKDDFFLSEISAGKKESSGNEKIQSTMRLMGKEFTVDGREFQGFEDGVIWKDKQIITDNHCSNKSIKNVMDESSVGRLRDTLFCPSEEHSVDCISKSRYAGPYFGSQTNLKNQNVFFTGKIDHAENSLPVTCEYESQLSSLMKRPTETASHPNCLHPNVSSSMFQLKNKQYLPPRPTIRFPFMHPDLEGHVQPHRYNQSSYLFCPSLVLDVSGKEIPMSGFQSFCNFGTSHHHPSVLTQHGYPGNPSVLTQHGYPGPVPISSVQKMGGNQKKISGQMMSRIASRARALDKKTKKQHSAAVLSNGSFKLPTSAGLHDGAQRSIPWSTTCVDFEGRVQNERTHPWMMDTTYGGITAKSSGLVKLTGGANHVLKGCSQIDQSIKDPETCLAATSTDSRFLEFDRLKRMHGFYK